MVTATPTAFMPRVKWSWLWGSRKTDLAWTFMPFWAGLGLAVALYLTTSTGVMNQPPAWSLNLFGRNIHIAALLLYVYSPLVDAPHLWATIARTYTDREEWAQRRRLFLGSLGWFLIGPVVILLPYVLHATVGFPAGKEPNVWLLWTRFFEFYALFHIAKQHWGFISLYKRKNADMADARENTADALFFKTAIWLPYLAMLTAPWYVDFDGRPFTFLNGTIGQHTVGWLLHAACNVLLLALSAAYALFQYDQWRKGIARNGPKLAYIATVLGLYFITFSFNPLVATFWVVITGFGHCMQYHRVVWAYGASKYAAPKTKEADVVVALPTRIFASPGLYIALGVVYGIVTLQGPHGAHIQQWVAQAFDGSGLHRFFAYLNQHDALSLGARLAGAFIGGTRLHHFYVDSKIWRVSKNAALAKNLNVAA
jgi:hypothetical protein